MNYIQDIPQEMILERLKKLCSLGGIKPPQQGKEFIELFKTASQDVKSKRWTKPSESICLASTLSGSHNS